MPSGAGIGENLTGTGYLRTDKLGLMKSNSFFAAKRALSRMKTHPTETSFLERLVSQS